MRSFLRVGIFFCLTLFFHTANAQAPSIVWQKCLGGSLDDNAAELTITPAGNYVVSGTAYSNNDDVTGHHGPTSFRDYWVTHTNTTGSIIWQKSFGGLEDELNFAIEETADGGSIVAGYSNSDGGQVIANHGYSDEWIIKLTSAGAIEWKTCYGGTMVDYATEIQQTSDGGYIVSGTTYSDDSDVTFNHGLGDYWLMKLDASGNIIWQHTYGGSGEDYGVCTIQTNDGGFIMSGFTNSTNGDISLNHGGNDIWIVRTDSMGNMLWQKSYGGTDWETNASIIATSDNGFLVTNSTISNNYDVSGNHAPGTFYDYWIFKINNSGDLLWQKCYGGTRGDYAYRSCETNDHGFVICGAAASLDGDVTGHHGVLYGNDNWVLKTDSVGTIEWELSLGGSLGDYGSDIKQTDDGGYIVLGSAESSDGDVVGIHGNYDYWMVKLGCTPVMYFADIDGDGFGNAGDFISACAAPAGYISDSTDCNDDNALIFPGQTEICNGLDENCNGLIDEDLLFTIYFADLDDDGFGDPLNDSLACATPVGYNLNNEDCNDTNAFVNPDAMELCNNADDNCDGTIDEGLISHVLYVDADGDGFGDAAKDTVTCSTGMTGYVSDSTDCDDSNALVFPGATEITNGIDDNCNDLVDENIGVNDMGTEQNIMMYPNPAIDILHVDFNNSGNRIIEVIQLNGEIYQTFSCFDSKTNLNIKNLTPGLYILKISDGTSVSARSFVKMNN